MKLNELTIIQASKGIRSKQFSVAELVDDCLRAIRAKDGELHAFLDIFDDAQERAKEADERLAIYGREERSNLPPLFGVPIAIKDNILVKGRRCTAGSRMLEEYQASYDATVVAKLKMQGAIMLGKTNLDEFAMGSSTEHSAFGPTKNPYDFERVPGGSSGGSAAAVGAHCGTAALGSDTGGSIRQPASFCGIVGFKPTYGAVSRHGLIAMASSLDQIGPMTKTVGDARILFDAIQGEDNFDATTIANGNQESGIRNHGIKELRIGVPKEYFGAGLDTEVAGIIRAAIKKIEASGAQIQEVSLPHLQYALPTYYIIVPSEVSANLARYDGIRYGSQDTMHVSRHTNLYDAYVKTRAAGFGAEVKRRIMLGTYTLSHGYYDAYYLKAQKVRRLIQKDFAEAFEKVDIILGPTTPTPAFRFDENIGDPLKMYLADIYTVAANLAGVPAISIPAGFSTRDGKKLPVGLQLIGGWRKDQSLLDAAETIETTTQ